MDTVAVLDEKDPHKRAVRLAAAIVISKEPPPAMCPWLVPEGGER